MKRILIILSVLLAMTNAFVQSQTLASVSSMFPDSLRGENVNSIWIDANGDILAAIAYGGLLRSTNDGKTWERIFKKDFLSNFGFGVMRDKKTNAILYGSGSGIFRSTDEGKSWAFVWSDGGGGCFLAKPDGSILGGMSLRITQSEDGGVTWREIFYDPRLYFNVEELAMSPKTSSIFAGVADTIGLGVLRSTDDGKTWHQANNGLGDLHVWSIASDENGVIYAGTGKKGLWHSTNNGDNWTKVVGIDAVKKEAGEILIVRPDLIFVGFGWDGIGDGGVFKYNGVSWTKVVSESIYSVMSLAVKGNTLLVGTSGDLYRVDGVIDSPTAVKDEPAVPTAFTLRQNYPNPFNPATTIEFSLPKRMFVTLKVVNILGQEVATLNASELSAGTHRIEWNGTSMPSGIYFYRLEANSFVATKKMVLVK